MSRKSIRKTASASAVDRLLRENLFLFFRARAVGERMFARYGQTPGKISLMRSVYEEGPQSVAQIARARPVARQGVQRMADQLEREGLVDFADNPAHQRARLVTLTPAGRELLDQIEGGAALWPPEMLREFDQSEIDTALAVTRKLRDLMLRMERSMAETAADRQARKGRAHRRSRR